jgi:hypothetical protein
LFLLKVCHKNPKFGYTSRIENSQIKNVLRLKLICKTFLQNWSAHGTGLEASYQLKYNRFIIIAVNQEVQNATGCSIDASVQFIQNLEKKYDVDLLDKMNVTFKLGEHIAHKSLLDFKKMAKDKAVTEKTIVFNNLVNTIEDWNTNWEVPQEKAGTVVSFNQKYLNEKYRFKTIFIDLPIRFCCWLCQ